MLPGGNCSEKHRGIIHYYLAIVAKETVMGYTADYADVEPTRTEIDAIAGPLLLEFGAPWCPHCQEVQSTLTELLGRFPEVRHVKIYDAKGQPLGRSFRVKLWPNLVFMRDGKVARQMARPSEDKILDGVHAIAKEPRTQRGLRPQPNEGE